MKQIITTDQLKELSEKGLNNYRSYLKGKYVDTLDYILDKNANPLDVSDYTVDQLPLLSIGEMIELLDWYWRFPKIEEEDFCCDNCPTKYRVDFYIPADGNGSSIGKKPTRFIEEEVCDALWEAVKEVLEHEQK